MELAQGVPRARSELHRTTRQRFLDDVTSGPTIYPITPSIAIRAGIWNGELAAQGLHPGLADLLIASTAVELGYRVVTTNVRHFTMIPGLEIVTL